VQTDGQRVAWQRQTPGNIDPPYLLQVAPVNATNSAETRTMSSEMIRFILKNGLLAWQEGLSAVTGYRLKVDTGTSTITLSTDSSATLIAVVGSSVVWTQGGKLYAWRAATGSRLLLDVAAPLIGDTETIYLTFGEQRSVYKLLLP